MRVGVPKEIKDHEYRIGLVPASVSALVRGGHQVLVEAGAGVGAGITDECVECQRCGRRELKSTVVLAVLDADGNDEAVTYYGSSCARTALGVRGDVLGLARNATVRTLRAAHDAHAAWETWGHGRYATVEAGELVWIRPAVRAHAAAGVDSAVKRVAHIERTAAAIADAAAIGYPTREAVERQLRRRGWL